MATQSARCSPTLPVPELGSLEAEAARVPTLAEAAKRWQASRVDVSAATVTYQRSAFNRARRLHGRRIDQISAADVAELVGELHAAELDYAELL